MHRLIIVLLFITIPSYGQDCNCESDFKWVKTTFETNDAGFSFAIKSKGEVAYQNHNEMFFERVKNITNHSECLQVLHEWLRFFRSGHIDIRSLEQNENRELSNDEIIEQYRDSEKIDVDTQEFKAYLNSKNTHDFEGIWATGAYAIGVKKVKDSYLGFIIEADGVYWRKGQIKFKIKADKSSVFYMRDHSERHFPSSELIGTNYIQIGRFTLKRSFPELKTSSDVEDYYQTITAREPFFKRIDREATYLRIPSFNGSLRNAIDSVIKTNREEILKTPNLIIDIRNNGGGSDSSYNNLMPLLYTNPIRTVRVEYYSTVLNNQRMMDFINKPEYGFNDEEKKWAKESFDKLSKKIGEFVNLDSTIVNVKKYDTVYQFPKNIGIIINENNGSTAEQFLLAAKQSKKVKLYGTTTAGVLDISNMYFVKSPCKEFELGHSLTRSMRIPGMPIDGIGIQPDYYIDESKPKYKWIDFVDKSLNNNKFH